MTPVQLFEQVAIYGGAIVSTGDCSEMEIADAKANGRFSILEDGTGFVRRTKEWLALQLAREKAHPNSDGVYSGSPPPPATTELHLAEPFRTPAIARVFAGRIGAELGYGILREIDARNADEANPDVCHSHDFCDANDYMHAAFMEVTGQSPTHTLPTMSEVEHAAWSAAWDYTKKRGFLKLGAIHGNPDNPVEELKALVSTSTTPPSLEITLPGAPPIAPGNFPLDVSIDFWGRNPHLQVLCRDHNSEEGQSVVCVRYDRDGKVCEVLIQKSGVMVFDENSDFAKLGEGRDTPWEIEREANPVCEAGDRLLCPSGQVGTVMRLRDRYDGSIEDFRTYCETYGILNRLDFHPACSERNQIYDSVEQAWDVNPLTVGTTDPSDFSCVPQDRLPAAENPVG